MEAHNVCMYVCVLARACGCLNVWSSTNQIYIIHGRHKVYKGL